MKKNAVLFYELLIVVLSVVCLIVVPSGNKLINLGIYLVLVIPVSLLYFKYDQQIKEKKDAKIEKLKSDLDKFNFELETASTKVSSVSEQLAVTLEDNHDFASALFERTKEMSHLNSDVNDTIHGIIGEIKSVITLMEDSKETSKNLELVSNSSNEVIKESLQEIFNIVSIIDEIQTTTRSMSEYVETLNETSKEINGILQTVSAISTQTNLLALNASIESARAGEAGKGFSVVADEIRKLSLDTGNAVNDIHKLVDAIQGEVNTVYNVTIENSSRVEKGVEASKSIEVSLGKINSSCNEVLDMVKKIKSLTQEEVALTSEVSNKIEAVENITTLSDQSVEKVYNSVHKQKHSMEDLSEMGLRLNDASKELSQLIIESDMPKIKLENTQIAGKTSEYFSIIKRELLGNTQLLSMDKDNHKNILKAFIDRHEMVEAAWTNDSKGRFICSIPEAGIANARLREWFKQSIQGKEYVSEVYVSAITKNPCITLSLPIVDESNKIIGVIGVDIKLGK